MTISTRRLAAFLFFACLALIGCHATPKHQTTTTTTAPVEPPLTVDQRQKNLDSFDQVWTTVRDKHFDPNYNGVDWNAVRVELRPKVEQATTMSQARQAMRDMLARLGETHFAILPASVYLKIDEAKRSAPNGNGSATEPASNPATAGRGSAGMELRVVNGHALVTKLSDPQGAASRAGVKPGFELVALNHKPVAPILAEIAASLKDTPAKIATEQAETIQSLFSGRPGRHLDVTFVDGSGQHRDLTIELAAPEHGQLVTFGNLPPLYVTSECKRLSTANVAYFGLNIFLDPVHVMAAYRRCVEGAAAAPPPQGADGFIIDLRGNPGGVGFMAVGMANMLVDKPGLMLGQMTGRGQAEFKFILDPQPDTYGGPVAVLVDECSASTSEILASGLKDIDRARVFGNRTAGAALPSVVEELPNGDRFQYAVANYVSSSGRELEGNGVEPDEVVAPDRASLLAGKDPALDAAVKWIESQAKHEASAK